MPYGTDVRGPIRVLYIDDDPGLGVLVQKAFARRGHSVVHVTDGAAGFARLAAGDIDVIALDHSLPGETGLDVLARLGPRSERPPVVYVTGSADARIAVQAIKAGADEYVIKDVSGEFYELLIAGVEHVLERWRLRRQKAEDEKAVRHARDRAEMLLQEVNHRIANSLGLVAAMVRMQATVLSDPAAVQALQETQARITAIAGVHRRLYTSDRIGLVEIDDYLGHLCGELQDSLADDDHPYEVVLEAERIEVSTDKAVSLGVIIGELVTNAFKYAYQKGRLGTIRVVVATREDGIVRLTVEDDGAGYDPSGPVRGTGLGSKILAAMATNLAAVVTQDREAPGTRIQVDFPLK
ncbi:sensor histidine kinase [Siculibacillus lacustris]|uniref:sensor histidine kinase n=1 Tax=Siculibacillus lacustris TaxID=1549641 RepID=UPI001D181BA5|nr:histidine kinase dimerization/phosphoacceptor domain -containing protein [Siculibacillus lacustris]